MKKVLYTIFALCCLLTTNAQILQENFGSYTTGNDLNTQGGWTNNSSNSGGLGSCTGAGCTNQKIEAAALAYPNYGTSSKAVRISANRDGCGKGWATAITSGSFYISFLVKFSDVTCGGTCTQDVDFFRILQRGDNFTTIARIFAKKTTATTFQFGIEKGNNGAAFRVYATTSVNFNTTHLVVIKYTFNTGSASDDEVKLFINPDMTSPEPAVATITSNLGSDNNGGVLDAAAISFRLNTAGLVPDGNYSMLSVALLWQQLSHLGASVNNIDRDLSNVKVFATSASQAVFQMNSNRTDALTIEVTDVMGRVVNKQTVKVQTGNNNFIIQTATLPKGIYNVRAVSSKGVTQTVRFIQ